MNILNSLRWVHTDALAAKITQGRSEKLAIAQQRHLLSRLNAMIDGCFTRGEKFFHSSTSWDTRSTFRLKTSERKAIFTSAVEIPLHKKCSFLLPACQGKSRPHAEQRAVAQTVSLLTSRSSLHDMFASISKGKFTNFVDLLSDADCYASINISEIEASDNSRKTGNQWMSPSETTSFVVTVTSSSISSIDGVGVGIDTRPTEEDENESVLARATSQDIYGALRSALDDAIRSLHLIMEKEGIELANELQLITLPRNHECRAGGSDSILRSYLCESLSFFDAAGITTINSAVYLTASEDVRASSIVQRLQRLSPSTLARSTCICSPWPTAVPEFSVERCLYSLNLLLQSVCSPSSSEAVASFHFGAGKQLSSCSPVTLTYCGADDNAGTVSSIAASVNQKIRTPQYWRQFCPLPSQMEIGEQLYFQSSHPFQQMFNYLAAAWLCVDRVLISSPHESTAAIHSGPLYAVSWAATLSPDKFIVNGNGIPTCNFFARSIIAADACVTSSVLPNAVLLSWWSRSLLGCRSNASVNMQLPLPAATQRAIGSASSYIHYLSLKKECQTVPDIIVMVQQMRERLGMSEDSFPSIKFSQRAYHSPQLQTLRLQGGEFGDVDVFTEVVAQWGPLGPFVAVSNPVKRHCGGNNTKVSTNPIEGNGNTRGPLQLLVNVLCRLYREVFPLSNYPLISVRHFATRKGLDFLLFSWFDSPPQVRTFEITATTPSTQTRIKFIRAMLFYDILGQRVLFGETHHFNSKEAICHLEVLAVSLNFPTSDPQSSESIGKEVHPKVLSPVFRAKHQQHVFETHEAHFRQFIYRCCHSAVAPPATVPADALKSFLTMVAHHRCPLGAMLSLIEEIYEGVVQLSVHPKEIDPLTRSHGYLWEDWAVGKRLPPLCGAVTLSLFRDSKERSMNQREAERTLTAEYGVKPGSSLFSAFQDIGRRLLEELLTEPLCHNIAGSSCRRRIIELCEDATSPILLRNGFPLFSAKDYHPPHLLGMVLQGVAGRYNCRYEHVPVGLNVIPASQDHFHQEGSVPTTFYCSPCENSEDSLSSTALVMCLVELPTLCGRDNSAGPSTPESIAGFPIGIGFGSTIKSAWASAAWNALRNNFPDVVAQLDLFRHVSETLRGPALLSVPQMANGLRWIWHPSLEKSECIVVSGEKRDNRGETGVARGVGQSAQQAYQRGAENFIKRTRDSAAENKLKFSSWRVETNFTKSIWHAYCGFLGALLGRRVQLASVRCSESSHIGLVLYCRHSCSNAQSEATRSCTSQILCSLKLSHVSRPLFDSGACTGGSCIREAQSAASMASQSVAQKSIRLLLDLTHALRDESMRVALTAQHSSILSEGALIHELNVLLSSLRQRMQQHAIGCHHLSNLRKAELLLEMWTGCQARTSVRCVSVQWRAEALVWLPKSSMSISGGNDFRPQVLLQCIGDSRHEAVSELLASIIAAIGL